MPVQVSFIQASTPLLSKPEALGVAFDCWLLRTFNNAPIATKTTQNRTTRTTMRINFSESIAEINECLVSVNRDGVRDSASMQKNLLTIFTRYEASFKYRSTITLLPVSHF